MLDLDKATHLEPTGPGTWTAQLDEQWSIGPKLHGGYLLAVLARAGVDAVGDVRPGHTVPQAITSAFLRAPDPGEAELATAVLRTGRSASVVRVALHQGGTPCVEATLTLGTAPTPAPGGGLAPDPVALAPIEQCPRSPARGEDGRGHLPIMDVVDVRLDPACTGFLRGAPSGEGRLSGWVALDAGPEWTPAGLLVALDALPPAIFDVGGPPGWSPTMTLTAHVHADAAPGPLRVTQWVDWSASDRMHESCHVWDAAGRLVGQSHQLAAIRS